MRSLVSFGLTFMATLYANTGWGHGFDLSVNSYTNPTAFTIASAQPVLDDGTDPTPGPGNLFLDAFNGTPGTLLLPPNNLPNAAGSYGTFEGFAQTSGPFPPYDSASFNIISPLNFSDGTGPAVPASTGTYLHIYDLWAGNPDPVNNPHPGASAGDVYVNGTTPFYPGFGVSLYDHHELEKDLFLAPGSTQTYGEYGFAFDVTVHFSNGTTLTSIPMVDVFALDITTDPDNPGGFATFAPLAQQDIATLGIYNAVTGVPEPSTAALVAIGALCGLGRLRTHRTRRRMR
jgi:hypothetical protein